MGIAQGPLFHRFRRAAERKVRKVQLAKGKKSPPPRSRIRSAHRPKLAAEILLFKAVGGADERERRNPRALGILESLNAGSHVYPAARSASFWNETALRGSGEMTSMQNDLERAPYLKLKRFLLLTFTLAISSLPRLGSASVPPPSVRQSQHSNALLALGTLEGEWIGTITVSHNQNGSRTHPIRRMVALENGGQFLRADTDYDVSSSAPSGALRSRLASETVIFTFDSDERRYKLLPLGYFNPLGSKQGRAELLRLDAKALTSFAADGSHVALADITAPSSIREMTLAWTVPDAGWSTDPPATTMSVAIKVVGNKWSEVKTMQARDGKPYVVSRIQMTRTRAQPAPQ